VRQIEDRQPGVQQHDISCERVCIRAGADLRALEAQPTTIVRATMVELREQAPHECGVQQIRRCVDDAE